MQTLYQFVLTQNVEPPFLLSNAFPRKSLELNATGDDRITSHDLGNAVLMIERDVSGNSALSFLELLEPSFSLHYVEQVGMLTLFINPRACVGGLYTGFVCLSVPHSASFQASPWLSC